MNIRVECCSGHKADERPVKFWLGESVLFVDSVEDQWYGPDDVYFGVRADDGNCKKIAALNAESSARRIAIGLVQASDPAKYENEFIERTYRFKRVRVQR